MARKGEYNSECRVECKCGCGGRTKYAYIDGHAPKKRTCSRCPKVFAPRDDDGDMKDMCSQCRRHVRGGGPIDLDTELAQKRRNQLFAPDGKKWCSGCEDYLDIAEFGTYTDRGSEEKTYSRCIPCFKEQQTASAMLSKYNLSYDEYLELERLQGGVCPICRRPPSDGKRLFIDHDHACCGEKCTSCGECIRGLLCDVCNAMLGFARDDAASLARAIAYLQSPPAPDMLRKIRGVA